MTMTVKQVGKGEMRDFLEAEKDTMVEQLLSFSKHTKIAGEPQQTQER